jgi:hypothetical protein
MLAPSVGVALPGIDDLQLAGGAGSCPHSHQLVDYRLATVSGGLIFVKHLLTMGERIGDPGLCVSLLPRIRLVQE